MSAFRPRRRLRGTPHLWPNAGASSFYHFDRLGTMAAITNSAGSVTDTRQYDAFGMPVTSSGTNPTPFGFVGRQGYQSDPDTGLMLLGHRFYDSSTGRFLSRDPAKDGRNWYDYSENGPLGAADPTGYLRWWIWAFRIVDWGMRIYNKTGIWEKPADPPVEIPYSQGFKRWEKKNDDGPDPGGGGSGGGTGGSGGGSGGGAGGGSGGSGGGGGGSGGGDGGSVGYGSGDPAVKAELEEEVSEAAAEGSSEMASAAFFGGAADVCLGAEALGAAEVM